MSDLDDFFIRKSSKYWMKSLIYDDKIVNFYDEGRFLFIESIKKDYIFDGYCKFNINVDDLDFMVQMVLNLIESKIVKFCKFDMLGLNGFVLCYIYLNSNDVDMMNTFLKEFMKLNIFKKDRYGNYDDVKFNFLKQNSNEKSILLNHSSLTTDEIK